MKLRLIKTIILTYVLIATLYSLTPLAYAQQITLSVSPPIVETIIKPGKSILIAYTFQNLGDPTALQVKIRPFYPKGEYGDMDIKDEFEGPIRFSLDNTDIKLETPFFVRTKDRRQALVRIRIPEGAPVGDYYFVVLGETVPTQTTGDGSSSIAKATIGSPLLITVTENGKTEIKGKIGIFDVVPSFRFKLFGKEYKLFDSTDKVPFVFMVRNEGTNTLKPQGNVTLRGGLGETSSYAVIPQNILSQSQRLLKIENPAAQNVPYNQSTVFSGFFLGKYNVSTNITFGEGSPQLLSSVQFYALPIRFGIGFFAVCVIVFFLISLFKQKNKKSDEFED